MCLINTCDNFELCYTGSDCPYENNYYLNIGNNLISYIPENCGLIEEVIPRKNCINTFVKDFYKNENILPILDIHYLEQYKFLIDEKNNLKIDFLGKFENLEKDFEKIFKLRLINYKIHKTKSHYLYYLSKKFLPAFFNKKMYRKFFDNESKDLMKKEYSNDFKYFNYEF